MIKPIETRYKGYRFRSRLEARWAVFFDALGLDWEYEPEGFKLSNGQYYLPDFKVFSPQGMVTWYEIKPYGSGHDSKLKQFATDMSDEEFPTTTEFRVLSGDPLEYLGSCPDDHVCPRCGSIDNKLSGGVLSDGNIYFDCWPCDLDTPSGAGDKEIGLTTMVRPHKGAVYVENKDYYFRHYMQVIYAAEKARSARFEHGEKG